MISLFVLVVIAVASIILLFVLISEVIAIFTTHAPFVPVPSAIQDEIIKYLELKEGGTLYDLGCGDGRILIEAVKNTPHITAVGIEKSFVPFFLAKLKTRSFKNIRIKREDMFKTDISSATHIFVYLYPKAINKLIEKLKKECKPGTILMSCDFEIENFIPTKTIILERAESERGKKLLVYTL